MRVTIGDRVLSQQLSHGDKGAKSIKFGALIICYLALLASLCVELSYVDQKQAGAEQCQAQSSAS